MNRTPPNKGLVKYPHTVHVRLEPGQFTWLKKNQPHVSRFLRRLIKEAAAGCPWIPPVTQALTRRRRKRTLRKSA